jgi:hypothetical protein
MCVYPLSKRDSVLHDVSLCNTYFITESYPYPYPWIAFFPSTARLWSVETNTKLEASLFTLFPADGRAVAQAVSVSSQPRRPRFVHSSVNVGFVLTNLALGSVSS